MAEPLVDTRLYVAVRPVFEYTLPEMGRATKACLLGDVPASEALASLAAMEGRCAAAGRADAADAEAAGGEAIEHARARARETIALMRDYLQDGAAAWEDALRTARAHLVQIERAARSERESAVRARHPSSAASESRFAARVSSARTRLHDALHRVREAREPTLARPAGLLEACEAVRRSFAAAHGACPTDRLLAAKRAFEAELDATQAGLAADFASRCARIIRG